MVDGKKQQETEEEPRLFEEKPEKKRGIGWFVAGIMIISGGFCLWPKSGVEGEAIIQAGRFAKIEFSGAGILKELVRVKGDSVKKGDVIARFENSEIKKQYEQQTLLLAKLNENKVLAEENAKFLEKEKDRKRILRENDVIGRDLLEKAELDSFNIAKGLVMLEKDIQLAQEELQYLKAKEDALESRAPFDGILLSDPSDRVGSPVKEGEFIFEIADPETYFLEMLIPEKDIRKVQVGDKVTVEFHAFPGRSYGGEVIRIASRTSEETEKVFKVRHVIPCEIKLQEICKELKYGMRGRVRIQSKHKGVLER